MQSFYKSANIQNEPNFTRFGLSVVNFGIWLLILVNGAALADDLAHNELFGNFDAIYSTILIYLVIYLVLVILPKKVRMLIYSIANAIGLAIFVIHINTQIIPSYLSFAIKIGLAIGNIYPIVIMWGIGAIFLLSEEFQNILPIQSSEQKHKLLMTLIFSFFILGLLGSANSWIFEAQIIYFLGIVIGFYLIYIILGMKQSQIEIQGLQKPLHKILGFFSFITIFGATYLGIDYGFTELFFGLAIGLSIFSLAQKYAKNKIPWFIVYIIGTLILILMFRYLATYWRFSDSTYITDPPLPFAALITGIAVSSFLFSFIEIYAHYIVSSNRETKNKDSVASKRKILLNKMKWNLVSAGFWMVYVGALLNALDRPTMNISTKEELNIMIFVFFGLFGFACMIWTLKYLYQGKSNELARIQQEDTDEMNSETNAGNQNNNNEKKDSKIHLVKQTRQDWVKGLVLIGLILVSGLIAYLPLVQANIPDTAGYPNYLGTQDRCAVVEVSPLAKIAETHLFPLQNSDNNDTVQLISRKMARNEFESVQIALSNWGTSPISLDNFSILNSTYGGYDTAFSLGPIEREWKGQSWNWSRITYQFVDELTPNYPDVLYDIETEGSAVQLSYGENRTRPNLEVSPGKSLFLWITLYADENLTAGSYSDTLSWKMDGVLFTTTILTEIWDFSIPVEHSLRVAIGNRKVYYLENRDLWTQNFLQHRISPYFPHENQNFYTTNGTEVIFNFTNLATDLSAAIAYGLDSFRITYKPHAITPTAFTSDFNATTISFYSQLATFLKGKTIPEQNKTWLDLAIVYAMDEPDEEDYPVFVKWANLVHSTDPGWKILLTEQVEDPIEDYVDIWCPHQRSVNTANIGTQHDLGREFWYYTCCTFVDKPTVSYIDPAVHHLALFWTAYAFDFDGYLFWDAAAYVGTDTNDPTRVGYDGFGDAIMLLNDAALSPLNTIVWETMRDGLEHHEYFSILEDLDPDNPLLDEVKEGWNSWDDFTRDYTEYLRIRNAVATAIVSYN